MSKPQTLKSRFLAIKDLEKVDTPWEVKHVFGEVQLFGSQLSIYSNGDNDFVDLKEFQTALTWLVEQCGGKVKWEK